MNKVILLGRLTRDPDIRYSQGNDQMAIARFTLAVDRRFKRDGNDSADFISCVAFGKTAEFFQRYVKQGSKMCVEGRIQTGSYVRQDGTKVYTTDVVVENAEFAESKAAASERQQNGGYQNGYGQQNPQNGYYAQQPSAGQFMQGGQGGSQYQQPAPGGYSGQSTYNSQPAANDQQPFMAPPVTGSQPAPDPAASEEGFMDIPDPVDDGGLPFQ